MIKNRISGFFASIGIFALLVCGLHLQGKGIFWDSYQLTPEFVEKHGSIGQRVSIPKDLRKSGTLNTKNSRVSIGNREFRSVDASIQVFREMDTFHISEKSIWASRSHDAGNQLTLLVATISRNTVISAMIIGVILIGGAVLMQFNQSFLGALKRIWRADYQEAPITYLMARTGCGVSILILCFTRFDGIFLERMSALSEIHYSGVGGLFLVSKKFAFESLVPFCRVILPWAAFLFLVIGFAGRIGVLITLFFFWVVASAEYTFFNGISHDFHIPLFCCLALSFGSCPSWCTVIRKKSICPQGTSIAVVTGCFLLSFVFLNAALYKIWFGNFEFLQWALSDAFRNKLLMRNEIWLERPVPDLLVPIVENQRLWQISGLMSIVMQALPFVCFLFFKRPWFRLAAAFFFIINITSLYAVMEIKWVLPWIPVAFIFVNWEWLTSKFGTEAFFTNAKRCGCARILTAGSVMTSIFLVVAAFSNSLNFRAIYPFGPFRMYSNLEAAPPFDKHQPWVTRQAIWEIETTPPLTSHDRAFFLRKFRGIWHFEENPNDLQSAAKMWLDSAGYSIHSMSAKFGNFEIAPYPSRDISIKEVSPFSSETLQ